MSEPNEDANAPVRAEPGPSRKDANAPVRAEPGPSRKDANAPVRAEPGPSRKACPHCGEPVERRQLVCLNCGGRVALGEQRSWAKEPVTALAAALMAVIVIGAALFGFAISELTSDDGGDDRPAATQASSSDRGPEVVAGSDAQPTETAPAEPPAKERGQTSTPSAPDTDPDAIPGWPVGARAHTVVLVTTSDGPAARRVAREARGSGLEAGLIRSDPYDLGTGLFVVYSGRFDTREGASRQAAGLQDRYPGAYAQLIQRSG